MRGFELPFRAIVEGALSDGTPSAIFSCIAPATTAPSWFKPSSKVPPWRVTRCAPHDRCRTPQGAFARSESRRQLRLETQRAAIKNPRRRQLETAAILPESTNQNDTFLNGHLRKKQLWRRFQSDT
jgi:hypothetical protein